MFAIVGIALATIAHAQDGFDAHGFVLGPVEPDVRDPVGWVRPGAFHGGDAYIAFVGEYARRPLVEILTSEVDGPILERPIIRDLGAIDLAAGVAVHERARMDLAFPVYLVSAAPGEVLGPAPGDLRATVSGVILRPSDVRPGGGVGLGLSTWIDAPIGTPERFLGRSGLAGGTRVTLSAEAARVTFNAHLGAQFEPKVDIANISGADSLVGGLGVAVAASDRVGIGLEATGSGALARNEVVGTGSPAEALLSVRVATPSGPTLLFGVGRALTRGVGASDVRALFGVSFGRMRGLREPDFDPIGALNVADRCPAEPETRNGWRDDDGCPDRLGAVYREVVFEGQVRPGAQLVIDGLGDPYTETYRPGAEPLEVRPETELTASATSDGCLHGTGSLVVAEGDNTLTVELERVLDARVTVLVEDMFANPIPHAEVTWLSDTPLCVPGEALTVGPDGAATTGIAAGEHQLVVDAEGYVMVFETFTFSPGDDRTFAVVMEAEDVAEEEPAAALVVVEAEQIRILEKVLFETGKAVIRPESFELLDQVAQTILDNPQVGRVEVAGHTDDRGSESYNLDLSQRRADAVRAYLIRQGVGEDRLIAVGYGETRPIADNSTEEGREANRRVEFNLIDAENPEEPTP